MYIFDTCHIFELFSTSNPISFPFFSIIYIILFYFNLSQIMQIIFLKHDNISIMVTNKRQGNSNTPLRFANERSEASRETFNYPIGLAL